MLKITLIPEAAYSYRKRFEQRGVKTSFPMKLPVNDVKDIQSMQAGLPATKILVSGKVLADMKAAGADLTNIYVLPHQPAQDDSPLTLDWLVPAQ